MSPEHLPIPPEIWAEMLAFLRDGKTGQITLYVHEGQIRDAAFERRVRANMLDSRQ